MTESQSNENVSAGALPVSSVSDVTAALMTGGQLAPPHRPGLLARFESYDLLRELGAGGMGVVYLARDSRIASGAEVAVKLLQPRFASDPGNVQRFLTEARLLRRLSHRNLMPVIEVVERGPDACLVMPYLANGTLSRAVRQGGALPPERTLKIAIDVAEALVYVHRQGLIHRDVKPGNVLLDGEGRAVLADFGLARTLFNESMVDAERAAFVGTAPYMSPAMARGEIEDTRCDIYGLGTVLYEMLTGHPPYAGAGAAEIRERVLAGPAPRIGDVNPKADVRLTRVAEWAMAREHRDRYASVGDLLSDLRRIEAGRVPLGPHGFRLDWHGGVERLKRQPGWRWALVGAGVALALGFLLWPRVPLLVAWKLTSGQVLLWDSARAGDWDGDGAAELLLVQDGRLLVYSPKAKAKIAEASGDLFAGAATQALRLKSVEDVNGDGLDDAWVSWNIDQTNGWLSLVSQTPRRTKTFESKGNLQVPEALNQVKTFHFEGSALHAKDRLASSDMCAVGLVRGRAPALTRLVTLVSTAYGKTPRGLFCYDFDSTRELWAYHTGAMIADVHLVDLDGDGYQDIVAGSMAPGNGALGPDESDDVHSWLFAVSHEGQLRWKKPIGDTYSSARVLPVDVNGDGAREVVAWTPTREDEHRLNRWDVGRVYAFDGTGNEVARNSAGACLAEPGLPIDLDGDNHLEILLTDCRGNLHVLGRNLEARKVNVVPLRYTEVELFLVGEARLAPSRDRYLVLQSNQRHALTGNNRAGGPDQGLDPTGHYDIDVLVLNTRLERVASYRVNAYRPEGFAWSVQVADADGDGVDEILVLTDRVTVLKLRQVRAR